MANDDGESVTDKRDLLSKLDKLYWHAVTREVCNMILFYKEVFELRDFNSYTPNDDVELAGDNFRKMFRLWSTSTMSLLTSSGLIAYS